MSRLIADLLLLSREQGQTISRYPTDYSALCEHSVDRLKARDGRRKGDGMPERARHPPDGC